MSTEVRGDSGGEETGGGVEDARAEGGAANQEEIPEAPAAESEAPAAESEAPAAESEAPAAETQVKLFEAVLAVSFATRILETFRFNDAVDLLSDEIDKGNVLPGGEDEPLFVYEVIATGRPANPYHFFSLANPAVSIRGEGGAAASSLANTPSGGFPAPSALNPEQDLLRELGERRDVRTDKTEQLRDFVEAFASGPKVEPEGYVLHDYQSLDPATLDLVNKRAVLHLVEKDGRTLLVGSSFRTTDQPQRASALHVFIVIGSYLAAWAVISYFFLRRTSAALPISIGAVGAVLLYMQYLSVQTLKGELTLSNALRSTSVAIAAASLGVSIFLRKSSEKAVVILVLLGFFLALLPLVLSGVRFGSGSLSRVNSVIIVLLALSVSCIVAALLLMLPSMGQHAEKQKAAQGAEPKASKKEL